MNRKPDILTINIPQLDGIVKIFSHLQKQNLKIMSKIDDLNQLVSDLQASVDAHQAQDAASIAALTQQIADLQAIIDAGNVDGATAEQLQAVIDSVTATKADIEGNQPAEG